MTDDIDSRLEAALHRIAAGHVPEGWDRELVHADQRGVTDIDAANTIVSALPTERSDANNRRFFLGVAAGVLILAGIGALLVLAPRGDTPAGLDQPLAAPHQSASTNQATLADGPVVTLGVTNTTANADTWSRFADNGLGGRSQHLVVATDGGLFVWGGFAGDETFTNGAFYDSSTGQWRTVPNAPLAPDRGDALGVWTGTEVVVINGVGGNVKSAAFNPTTFTWRALSDPPVDNAANAASRAVLMGDQVMLFSIFEDGVAPHDQVAVLDDLQSGHWSVVDSPPIALHSAVDLVAAGPGVAVIGRTADPTGCEQLHVLTYTPTDNSWKELPAGPASLLADPVSVWTGSELFIGGGGSCNDGVASAGFENGAYLLTPSTGEWRTASPAPEAFYSSARYPDVWTGTSVATISPSGRPLLYNPTTDRWHLGPAIGAKNAIASNQAPMVLLDGSLIISGGNLAENSGLCCKPFTGTYAYTIPNGF